MGHPTVILPGYLAGALPYQEMQAALQSLGIPAHIVPLKRRDWFPTLGGRSMLPILQQLDHTIKQVQAETGSDRINLVGHSAGGWISRIYLGEVPYDIHPGDAGKVCLWKGATFVKTLVTLGTPHVSQERWTKRNLDFVKTHCSLCADVRYVCVAGKAIYGKRAPATWFAYSSYELTVGQGNCWGDGVTPIAAAHLEGAENLTLENVLHSPRPGRLWYGSEAIVPLWAKYLVLQL
ncbi:lipase [Phormidium tenue FACHB-886]|nr:lipase [Phormidium tenue FACHB-886]